MGNATFSRPTRQIVQDPASVGNPNNPEGEQSFLEAKAVLLARIENHLDGDELNLSDQDRAEMRLTLDLLNSETWGIKSPTNGQYVPADQIRCAEPTKNITPSKQQAETLTVAHAGAATPAPIESFLCFIPNIVATDIIDNFATPDAKRAEGKLSRRASFSAKHPGYREFEAAVLFADMSGFTALTERLAGKANGAERLCNALNQFFGQLLDIVYLFGGDCVKFAGDALKILWPVISDGAGPSTLKEATVKAARCSDCVHAALKHYPRTEGVLLSMHMGLGSGAVTTLYVGGMFARWEYVVAGDPNMQVAIAEPLAGAGETIASPKAWSYLHDVFFGSPLASHPNYVLIGAPLQRESVHNMAVTDKDASTPKLSHSHLKLTKSFIPNAIYRQLISGYDSYLAEMRVLSVLFIKIEGLTVQNESSLKATHHMMVAVQKATYQFMGSVNKLLVDDKGTLMLVAYGLPPLAHIDDPVRAVAGAFAIRRNLQELGLSTCIGITTGEMFCGVVGSHRRREYTVMGDSVNLSARLMAAASSDEILVDETTALRCLSLLQFETLPPLRVKGKVKPVNVFRPVLWLTGHHAKQGIGASAQTVLLGRESESHRLSLMLRNIVTARRGIICILGEHGIGKSTLVHASLTEIAQDEHNFLVLGSHSGTGNFLERMPDRRAASTEWGSCLKAVNILESFKAWESVLLQAISVAAFAAPLSCTESEELPSLKRASFFSHNISDSCIQMLTQILPQNLVPHVSLLRDWLPGLKFDSLSRNDVASRSMSPGDQQKLVLDMFASILIHTSRSQPTLCILDGCESMDEMSWLLLEHMQKILGEDKETTKGSESDYTGEGLFICCISRPFHHTNRQFERYNRVLKRAYQLNTLVKLRALSYEGYEELVYLLLGVPKGEILPPGLLEFVWKKSRGNPFFVREMLQHLLGEQMIYVSDHQCLSNERKSLLNMTVPQSLHRIAQAAMDRLTTHEQMVVKIASVMQQPFSAELLFQVFFANAEDGVGNISYQQVAESVHGQALITLVAEDVFETVEATSKRSFSEDDEMEILRRPSSDGTTTTGAPNLKKDALLKKQYRFHSPIWRQEARRLLLSSQRDDILRRIAQIQLTKG